MHQACGFACTIPLLMTPEDWQKHKNATDCHTCNKSLVKDLFLDPISVRD